MNSVSLIGNLATEVDLREVGEDKKVASFLLAVDRFGPDGGADFVRVSVWNRQAEICDQYLSKGRRVAVEGRLRSSSWEDADGNRRSAVEVTASFVQFLSTREEAAAASDDVPFEAAGVT
jgi:single-strand DNA-binding protein